MEHVTYFYEEDDRPQCTQPYPTTVEDILCWNDHHPFSGAPVGIPVRKCGTKWYLTGYFCCPGCALRFIQDQCLPLPFDTAAFEQRALLRQYCKHFFGVNHINAVPPRFMLAKYYPNPSKDKLSIADYRRSNQNEHHHYIIEHANVYPEQLAISAINQRFYNVENEQTNQHVDIYNRIVTATSMKTDYENENENNMGQAKETGVTKKDLERMASYSLKNVENGGRKRRQLGSKSTTTTRSNKSKSKSLRCFLTPQNTSDKEDTKQQQKQQHNVSKCPSCDTRCNSYKQLQQHYTCVHGGEIGDIADDFPTEADLAEYTK